MHERCGKSPANIVTSFQSLHLGMLQDVGVNRGRTELTRTAAGAVYPFNSWAAK
jgi:hypothetical protein